jgi:hypothetical protein
LRLPRLDCQTSTYGASTNTFIIIIIIVVVVVRLPRKSLLYSDTPDHATVHGEAGMGIN